MKNKLRLYSCYSKCTETIYSILGEKYRNRRVARVMLCLDIVVAEAEILKLNRTRLKRQKIKADSLMEKF